MLIEGVDVPSRFQGDSVPEFIIGFLASQFGPYGPNTASLLLSLAAAAFAARFIPHPASGRVLDALEGRSVNASCGLAVPRIVPSDPMHALPPPFFHRYEIATKSQTTR